MSLHLRLRHESRPFGDVILTILLNLHSVACMAKFARSHLVHVKAEPSIAIDEVYLILWESDALRNIRPRHQCLWHRFQVLNVPRMHTTEVWDAWRKLVTDELNV